MTTANVISAALKLERMWKFSKAVEKANKKGVLAKGVYTFCHDNQRDACKAQYALLLEECKHFASVHHSADYPTVTVKQQAEDVVTAAKRHRRLTRYIKSTERALKSVLKDNANVGELRDFLIREELTSYKILVCVCKSVIVGR